MSHEHYIRVLIISRTKCLFQLLLHRHYVRALILYTDYMSVSFKILYAREHIVRND